MEGLPNKINRFKSVFVKNTPFLQCWFSYWTYQSKNKKIKIKKCNGNVLWSCCPRKQPNTSNECKQCQTEFVFVQMLMSSTVYFLFKIVYVEAWICQLTVCTLKWLHSEQTSKVVCDSFQHFLLFWNEDLNSYFTW